MERLKFPKAHEALQSSEIITSEQKLKSRLLKYFMDDYILNRRSEQDEKDIIDEVVNANIPIPDVRKATVQFKSRTKSKQKKEAPRTQAKAAEEPRIRGFMKKDLHTISNAKMKESLLFGGTQQTLLEQRGSGEADNDSDYEDPVLGRGTTLASIDELNDQVRRGSQVVRIVDAKLQVEKDRLFIQQLQNEAITPPSLEFLPSFENFVTIMQTGIQSGQNQLLRKPLKQRQLTVVKMSKQKSKK